jgi:transcription elongation factor
MHVKVIAGRNSGATGRVVSQKVLDGDKIAVVLTDGMNTEIHVQVSALQQSSEVSVGYGNLGGYELYDLVSLNVNETAMVIAVGAERLKIINHMDVVKDVLPQELQKNRNRQSARSTGFDAQQATVQVGDLIEVRSGPHVKRKGTVKAIMNGCFWVHSTNHLKNSGIFVIRGRHCVLSGKVSGSLGATLNTLGSKAAASANMPNLKAARDPMIGKTVKIIQGGFKSFLAQVVDATATQYTVELLARVKKIVIDKSKCKEVGDREGSYVAVNAAGSISAFSASSAFGGVSDTPFIGSDTPFLGGETPHYSGGETPMQDGSQTPMQENSGFGVRQTDYEDDEEALIQTFGGGDNAENSPTVGAAWGGSTFDRSLSAHSSRSLSVDSSTGTGTSYSPSSVSSGGSPLPDTGTGSGVTYRDWVPSLVVVLTDAVHLGRTGVLERSSDAEGNLSVSLLDSDGQKLRSVISVHFSGLRLSVVGKGDSVFLFKRDPSENQGRCIGIAEGDVVVMVSGRDKPQLIRKSLVAKLYTG